MRPQTEKWTLIRENEPLADESTGNRVPVAPSEFEWTGSLHQRQLSASSVDAGNTEFEPGHVVGSYVLLLTPGLTPFPARRDKFRREEDGEIFTITGTPRERRRMRGSRRPVYIAAIVRNANDLEEKS
ncbi:hypothetical protein G8767_31730 [Rhodococcus sp. IC4_135]|uniref:hypothetical protein n=1 Tax=Rhodococcus sp. IC4_135 TaxID=2715537 RepID=UPI00141F96A5|nr:hypothetical protein [Rhodococcus sp. IC4_135]